MPNEFHENLLIWKDNESAWNGIGFFGQSKHGKTPLSLAFARVLFANGMHEIKLFDDCFKIENGRIRQCRVWGRRDQLGETYYSKLAETMNELGHSISELEPGDHSYLLRNVAAYLLIADTAVPFMKQRCSREEFVEALMPTNPFTWDDPKPGKDVVFQRFKSSWSYYIIHRQSKTTQELIELLTKEAFEDTKVWRKNESLTTRVPTLGALGGNWPPNPTTVLLNRFKHRTRTQVTRHLHSVRVKLYYGKTGRAFAKRVIGKIVGSQMSELSW